MIQPKRPPAADRPATCVFVVYGDVIAAHGPGGGSSLHFERLLGLASLGTAVHLWHYAYPAQRAAFDAFRGEHPAAWREVEACCRSVTFTTLPDRARLDERILGKLSNRWSGRPVRNPLFRTRALPVLRRLADRAGPDLVWAQCFGPLQIATLQRDVPVVYGHHDWLYHIKALAAGRPVEPEKRRFEEEVTRRADVAVSGSAVDCAGLRAAGCAAVRYVPVSYESEPLPAAVAPAPVARLVHLGGMSTTATRVGLERFLEHAWPALEADGAELDVVGSLAGAQPGMLEGRRGVAAVGFVPALRDALRPFDLHVIPWGHATGQRTRLPVAFNHAQVVVSLREGIAGFPEAVDGENCRLVDDLDELVTVVRALRRDPAERRRLGLAAKETFERCYTRDAVRPAYRGVLDAVRPALEPA